MGEVYEVVHPLGRRFALKLIRPDRNDPEFLARFRNEAGALMELDHPHIARIFEYAEKDGCPYFTMRLLLGGTLESRKPEYQGDPRKAAELLVTVADAVGLVHRRGLLHRDLKPGNILFDEEGRPYVSDFGLVKGFASVESDQFSSRPTDNDPAATTPAGQQSLTGAGFVLGTIPYMSPEQVGAEGDKVGAWSDVWSLGVMLYELIEGRRPFAGKDFQGLRAQIQAAEIPSSPRLAAVPGLEPILRNCLSKEPSERYPSAGALAEELLRCLKQPSIVPTGPRPVLRLALIGGVAGVLILLAVLFLNRDRKDDPPSELEKMQAKLARGEKVQFLGEKGLPDYYRVRTAHGTNVWTHADGTMTIDAQRVGIVEIMPDPKCDEYAFRVWVRHNSQLTRASRAGIVCLHSSEGKRETSEHYFLELSIQEEDEDAHEVWKQENKPAATRVGSVGAYFRVASGEAPGILNQPAGQIEFASESPERGQPEPWRELRFEITRERIQAFHGKQEVAVIPLNAVQRRAQSLIQKNPELSAKPPFGVNGRLCLYVFGGSASFRLGAIEPLTKTK